MVRHLLLVMSVHFQFVGLAMNMRGRMEINLAPSAKRDTRDIKVENTFWRSCLNVYEITLCVIHMKRILVYVSLFRQ